MKKIILILIVSLYTTACKAQQAISKIVGDKVKVNNVTYKLEKPDNKVTEVINSNNKLTNIKQFAPNLPSDMPITAYAQFDKKLLIQICADAIPLSTLQKLPKGYGDFLFIDIKINKVGQPLEMEFLIRNSSLITPMEINQIESAIKTKFKVAFKQGITSYFEGANYFNIYAPIQYSDMLKEKESN